MAHVLAEGPSRGERAELDGDQPPAGVLADPDLADAGVHGHLLVAVGGAVALDVPDDGGVAVVADLRLGRLEAPVGAESVPGGPLGLVGRPEPRGHGGGCAVAPTVE